jgi:hypothetical protein
MHLCLENGAYPGDAGNLYQSAAKSPNASAQRNVIVKVAFFASESEAPQNSGHGARAPGNDLPNRGPPPMSFLQSLSSTPIGKQESSFIQLINRILLQEILTIFWRLENEQ